MKLVVKILVVFFLLNSHFLSCACYGISKDQRLKLLGNRFFTFSTVVRVNQIETSRDKSNGTDEASVHGPEEARTFREAIEKVWPGARITWSFSWLALKDQRPNYLDLKKLVVSYHEKYGDEITFIPGGYFANMYNSREQINRDLHEGLQMVSEMVGGGYRPQSVIAGFLSAENLRYLAEEEGIHVCQGNIWSQYAVDNGDGEGSISYPYYPSHEHFCKPAQGKEDLIDCVNLDGWTVDFVTARFSGAEHRNVYSRQGVGPIETLLFQGTEQGTKEMMATTAAHFDKGFELNNFAWVTCIWELCLVEGRKIYGYNNRNGMDGMVIWLNEMRRRWPEAKCITQGEFGMLWREQFKNNDSINYRFVMRGSGVRGSEPEMEIRWFMNKDFRLALLKDWKANTTEKLIDFTRYDIKAQEPDDPKPEQSSRNWSLMNRLNQKGIRPQDKPIAIGQLNVDEQTMIKRRYPELLPDDSKTTATIAGDDNLSKTVSVSTTTVTHAFMDDEAPGWRSLTAADFTQVNSADNTWWWKDGVLCCTGQPVSVNRTIKEFGNFEMVVEWMHEKPAGNSGVFVWATPASIQKLTDAGKPGLPDGIEVQILDHGFTDLMKAKGAKTDWFGTNGDVFAVRVKMTPFPPLSPDGSRSFPRKNLAKGHGEWNHYYIRAINGEVRLWVNGEEVSGGTAIEPRKGYLCLESEGSPIQFRKLRIRELP
jgi:hypothetical protein